MKVPALSTGELGEEAPYRYDYKISILPGSESQL